jgi:hypothetical protein
MSSRAQAPDAAKGTVACSGSAAPENYGDLIFSLYDRQERIADRFNKKIDRLDQRLTALEERRRP